MKGTLGKVLRRTGIVLLATVLFLLASLYFTIYSIAHGPSPTVRDMLILAAHQTSGVKWAPGLFFDDEFVAEVIRNGEVMESISMADLLPNDNDQANNRAVHASVQSASEEEEETDPWDDAIDGMLFDTYICPMFEAYVLLVKDPSRVFTARSPGEYSSDGIGMLATELAQDPKVVAAINGGSFYDIIGVHTYGGHPLGLTYSEGECVWDDGTTSTFLGFDSDDKLIVKNSMTRSEADALGIRDGVSFQTNNILISNEDGEVSLHYKAPTYHSRTAIGQTADGTVILMVAEGRTADALGASHYDMAVAMLYYGAVTAGMLDGGNSTSMIYPTFFEKYGIDESGLSETQRLGFIYTGYKIGYPGYGDDYCRHLPTFFAVRSE